jgi:hypothetical protein
MIRQAAVPKSRFVAYSETDPTSEALTQRTLIACLAPAMRAVAWTAMGSPRILRHVAACPPAAGRPFHSAQTNSLVPTGAGRFGF